MERWHKSQRQLARFAFWRLAPKPLVPRGRLLLPQFFFAGYHPFKRLSSDLSAAGGCAASWPSWTAACSSVALEGGGFSLSRRRRRARVAGVQSSVVSRLISSSLARIPKGFEEFFSEEARKTAQENQKDDDGRFGNGGRDDPPRRPPILAIGAGLLTILAAGRFFYQRRLETLSEISQKKLLNQLLTQQQVERIDIVNKEKARIILKSEYATKDAGGHSDNYGRPYYIVRIGSVDSFEAKVEALQRSLGLSPSDFVPVHHVQELELLREALACIPTVALFAVALLVLRRLVATSQHGDPSKFLKVGRANPVSGKHLKGRVKFSDVAGMKDAKREVMEFVDFLKDPAKYQRLGAHIPKGALLVGPPGTGKTLLAKAVAGEAEVPFYSMSGSDFIEVFVGVGPSRVRDLFQLARRNAPSIVFIDEIDAVGRKRQRGGFAGGANDERENTLNQMLVEMDGFTSSMGVVVLAGTNRADILDPALTRPGRFDRTITIEKPDLEERAEIFKIHLGPLHLTNELTQTEVQRRLAALTPGFAGADIRNVCNEAAIFAARRNASGVALADFEDACERVLGGVRKSTAMMTEGTRRSIAYHEAGHAVAGWFLKYADPVLKVSIVPRVNGALGYTQSLPDEVHLLPKEQVLDKIAMLLGGRVAEELHVGQVSTGASDDLDKVTRLAYAYVSMWGFNPKIGLISFQPPEDMQQYHKPYSENLAQMIDTEVKNMIEVEYQRVKQLLRTKKELVETLTARLLARDAISFADLVEVLGERPFPLKEEYAQYIAATQEAPSRDVADLPAAPCPTEPALLCA